MLESDPKGNGGTRMFGQGVMENFTIREALQQAILILIVRANEIRRLNQHERDTCSASIDSINFVLQRGLGPDSLVPAADRAEGGQYVRGILATLVPVESAHDAEYQPWEFYNALDLLDSCAGAIEAGESSITIGL
jgi:hypothetical protein